MNPSSWVDSQIQTARDLAGSEIVRWHGEEFALRVDGPIFEEPGVRCLQLSLLTIETSEGLPFRLTTYQNDDQWGLTVARDDAQLRQLHGIDEGSRRRHLDELPTGSVEWVTPFICTDRVDLAELILVIEGQQVLLVAGELYENSTPDLDYCWMDESVLVFVDPTDADSIDWGGRRSSRQRLLPTTSFGF